MDKLGTLVGVILVALFFLVALLAVTWPLIAISHQLQEEGETKEAKRLKEQTVNCFRTDADGRQSHWVRFPDGSEKGVYGRPDLPSYFDKA